MSFKSLISKNTYQILRKSNILLAAKTVTATVTGYTQPSRASSIKIIIDSGTTGSGTVTITGTVSGVANTEEELVFTANGIKNTVKQFTAISSITTTGLADETVKATIELKAITPTGQPIISETQIFSAMPGWLSEKSGGISVIISGAEITTRIRLLCEYDANHPLMANDIVVDNDSNRFIITFIKRAQSLRKKIHHLECGLKRE